MLVHFIAAFLLHTSLSQGTTAASSGDLTTQPPAAAAPAVVYECEYYILPAACQAASHCYFDGEECATKEGMEDVIIPHKTPETGEPKEQPEMKNGVIECKAYDRDPAACNKAAHCYHDHEECVTHEAGEMPEMEDLLPGTGFNGQPAVGVHAREAVAALNTACGTLSMSTCQSNTLCQWNGALCIASESEVEYGTVCKQWDADSVVCGQQPNCVYDVAEQECLTLAEEVVGIELKCEKLPKASCKAPCMFNEFEHECVEVDKAEGAGAVCSTLTAPDTCQAKVGICVWLSETCLSLEAIDLKLKMHRPTAAEVTDSPNVLAFFAIGLLGCVLGFSATLIPRVCSKNDNLDDVLLETHQGQRVV